AWPRIWLKREFRAIESFWPSSTQAFVLTRITRRVDIMKIASLGLIVFLTGFASARGGEPPSKPIIAGVKNLQSVTVGPNAKLHIPVSGAGGTQGQGMVMVLDKGKAVPFARGLDEPRGIAGFQGWLFVADKHRVWRIDARGKATVFVGAAAFPVPPHRLTDV